MNSRVEEIHTPHGGPAGKEAPVRGLGSFVLFAVLMATTHPGEDFPATRLANPPSDSSLLQEQQEAIAFIRDGDVWLIRPDGADERRLTYGGDNSEVALSPDGSTIAFVRSTQEGDPPQAAGEIGLLDTRTLVERTVVGPEGNCWPVAQ